MIRSIRKNVRYFIYASLSVAIFLFTQQRAAAQSQSINGTIHGTVTDASGKPVANAKVDDTETDRYGLRLFAISDSYVKEVETVSNAFNAEFGNTTGIIYNVITPSGTNEVHGLAHYLWRPEAASACPSLLNCATTAKPDLHDDDVVGSVGGPVIKNRFFYRRLRAPQALQPAGTGDYLCQSGGAGGGWRQLVAVCHCSTGATRAVARSARRLQRQREKLDLCPL
jgi:hypothetical protein